MEESAFDLEITSVFCGRSCDHYDIQTFLIVLLVEPVCFSDQSGDSVAYHTVSNFFAYGYSKAVIYTLVFKYIHYKVTDEKKRSEVRISVSHIVRLPKMSQVCAALKQLMKDELVLSSIEQGAMLAELRRLGLPDESVPGFSDQNFYSAYSK